ncbi:hypothetical protein QBK99_08155 [Corticibacterium sp. UT-5YL-CI-8]|nr:hypothetical protein [Tianweitania sp. UT-5YL-CI-8]
MAEHVTLLPGMTHDPRAKPARYMDGRGHSRVVLRTISDLDGRSVAAKRASALKDAIISDLTGGGTVDDLSAIKRQLVESVAIMSVVCEDIQSRYLSGDPAADLKQLTVLLNARRRDCQLLGLDRVARDVTGNLELYLSQPNGGR